MSEVVLILPDELATEAKEMGLFKPLIINSLLREAIRRRKVNRLFDTMDRLAALPDPPTEEEIAEEIAAVRRERKERSKS